MDRAKVVEEIVSGERLITSDHPFKNDILFFKMLEKAAADREWFEVCALCVSQIQWIENRQNLEILKQDINKLK